jgi:hypothetical protein
MENFPSVGAETGAANNFPWPVYRREIATTYFYTPHSSDGKGEFLFL